MTRRPLIVAGLLSVAAISALILVVLRPAVLDLPGGGNTSADGTPAATERPPIAVPIPGHEVYGFVPYWEMDDTIVDHLETTDLTTLGLFSVTHIRNGDLATGENGYRAITGEIGRRMIRAVHDRGSRVELVYTSFGQTKNAAFFGSATAQTRTIDALVGLVDDLDLEGVNVDVELLGAENIPAYGLFVSRLREALRARIADAQVSVATTANERGTAMAVAASLAGADRIFVMGYDYRTAGSAPGASAPLDRRDGSQKDLVWSLDLYRDAGVPAERTILGLPLYGMTWPVAGPELGAAQTGRGAVWIPRRNLASLQDPPTPPTYDWVENVELLTVPDGDGWRAIYVDTPVSLAPKLALADTRGLAGAGFWAIGYERGLPEYTRLLALFRSGKLEPPG